jgi:cell division protein FtsZ
VLTAAVAAISNPLIENPSIKRASGLIISITGGKDLMLFEVDEAATRIREEADQDANIIIGASFDECLEGVVRVSVVATGIDNLDPALQAQSTESSLTQLAGRLRDDSHQIVDRIERGAPLTNARRVGTSI